MEWWTNCWHESDVKMRLQSPTNWFPNYFQKDGIERKGKVAPKCLYFGTNIFGLKLFQSHSRPKENYSWPRSGKMFKTDQIDEYCALILSKAFVSAFVRPALYCGFSCILEYEKNRAEHSHVDFLKMVLTSLFTLRDRNWQWGEKLNSTAASSHKRFHKSVPSLIMLMIQRLFNHHIQTQVSQML